MNKKIIIPALALTILGGTVFAVKQTKADEEYNYPPMVQEIVEHFNLDSEEVSEVLDSTRRERHYEMETRLLERLDEAINEGSITEEQKVLFLKKHEEMEQERLEGAESRYDYTRQEWQTKMQEHHEEMESWANENGIDLYTIMPGPGTMHQNGKWQNNRERGIHMGM